MGDLFAGENWLSPTPSYYEIQGRAAEIARSLGTPAGAEHLFLGMLHAGSWPLLPLEPLIDLGAAEDAVLRLLRSPDYTPPPRPGFPAAANDVPLLGGDIAAEQHDSHLGLEHALLAMMRARESVPARALASLADLGTLEAALLAAQESPPGPPADAVFLPEGRPLDSVLLKAVGDALPADTTFGFNFDDRGRTWLHVFGPDAGNDPALTRRVLNTALARLDRAPLDD
jgi:hypothetical protein